MSTRAFINPDIHSHSHFLLMCFMPLDPNLLDALLDDELDHFDTLCKTIQQLIVNLLVFNIDDTNTITWMKESLKMECNKKFYKFVAKHVKGYVNVNTDKSSVLDAIYNNKNNESIKN